MTLASGGLGGIAAASSPASDAVTPIHANSIHANSIHAIPIHAEAVALGRVPFGEYVNRLSFDVAAIEPALVTAAGPTVLTISGTMTNTGPDQLTDLAYRFQRGPALSSTADVRQELAEPSEPTDRVPAQFTSIVSAVPPGGTVPFSFTASIINSDGLAVSEPGVYPVMVNVNGAVTLDGGPLEARIGELHLLLTVMGVPSSTPTQAATGTVTAKPLPVNFVWPLVDQPHLGVGGVFLNEDLLGAISPGGRLTTLVNGLTDPASRVPDGTVTVVIDPQLLDELDRMSGDYRVVATGQSQPSMTEMLQAEGSIAATVQPSAESSSTTIAEPSEGAAGTAPVSTPTVAPSIDAPATGGPATGGPADTPATNTPATNSPSLDVPPEPAADPGSADIPGTVAGTGQQAAASFLGRLRDVAARYPILVLPYGDPDVVALVRAGMTGEVSDTVERGQSVAERVLSIGTPPRRVTSMAFPINGASDSDTLAALKADGLATALLSESSVQVDGLQSAAAQLPTGQDATGTMPVAIAQADVLSGVNALIDQGREAGWAMRVNALTGVLAQQSLDGIVTPAVFTPDRRWSPDAAGLRVLTDLLATLGASKVIAGTSLSDLAGSATSTGTADYPTSAQKQELSADYLERIRVSQADVASLRQTLASTPQTADPNLVLDPLDVALHAAASTAFRLDPAVGQANLATVEATTAGIRSGVGISSAGNSYTLASSTSPLVLTVQNNLPYDVPVRVEISGGERVGLTVTDPAIQVVPAGGSQQVKIPAEVTRSGQFQVYAHLVGADGVAWGPPVQLSVESTAYGALTVIIIIVAGGVLVLMVGLRIVQRLRGKPDTAPGLSSSDDRASDRLRASGQAPSRQDAEDRPDLRDVIAPPDPGSTPQTEPNRRTSAVPPSSGEPLPRDRA